MKIISFALLLLALPMLAVPGWAGGTIKEADYPNQYEVLSTSKTSKLVIEKSCSMALSDKAKPGVAINVSKSGSCQLLDSGKVYRGRENEKKNEIELVIPLGSAKAKVENWQITGTVDTTPRSDRPTS